MGDWQTLDSVTWVTVLGVAGHSSPDTEMIKGSAPVTFFALKQIRPVLLVVAIWAGPSRSRGFKTQIHSKTHASRSFSTGGDRTKQRVFEPCLKITRDTPTNANSWVNSTLFYTHTVRHREFGSLLKHKLKAENHFSRGRGIHSLAQYQMEPRPECSFFRGPVSSFLFNTNFS